MFDHLPKPFSPGVVIPSNRSPGQWHFTFRDAEGHDYHWRVSDLDSAAQAKAKMRQFCIDSGNTLLTNAGQPNLDRVVTRQEVEERLTIGYSRVHVESNLCDSTYFFCNQHGYKWQESKQRGFVSSTLYIPHNVVAREGVEDGVVDTLEKLLLVYFKDYTEITPNW